MSEINQNPPSTFELTGVNLESNPKMEGVLQEEPSSLQNLKESVFIKEEFKTPSEKPPLSLKKEISTIKAPVVQFARKNDPKLMINSQNNAKLPPVKQKKSIIRASTSNTSLPRNQLKLEKLKNVLDDMKIGKKELKKTVSASDHVKSFANAYEQRIIE